MVRINYYVKRPVRHYEYSKVWYNGSDPGGDDS
jgi:hypothetical protein